MRPPNPKAKVLLLDCDGVDDAFNLALTQEGDKYDFIDILGIATGHNWSKPGEFFCDKLVFWSFIQKNNPLLNHDIIPVIHLTPRDILLNSKIRIKV